MRCAAAGVLLMWAGCVHGEVQIHGFLMGNLAVRTTGERPPRGEGGAFVLGEERLRLDLSGAAASGRVSFLVKGDLFHDAVSNRVDGDLREAYAGFRGGPLDLRLGRQIVTWGAGDLFFINDVFPKDWESFFSGRPMEYLKRGVDAVRAQYSSPAVNLDLVATPFFRADALPSPKRFFLYDPFAGIASRQERKPPARAANTEVALRLSRRLAGFDLSLYGYRGYWRMPAASVESEVPAVVRFYPRLLVWGASAQRNWLAGVVSLEAGRYGSRDDRRGANPAIPNSEWRMLAGYQRQLAADLTGNVQFYAEIVDQSPPLSAAAGDRFRGILSARLTQFLRYQSWRLSLFLAYSPTGEDFFLQPEISHRLTDRFSVAAGANIFAGRRETTFFGRMRKSDNVYISARADF
ncbi:MAG: DUF1302 family protein [Acidobacteriota bacterium]